MAINSLIIDAAIRHYLQSGVRRQKVAPVYLLVGPAQVGKTTLADWFTRALLCQSLTPDGEPCGQCAACHQVIAGTHPDIFTLALAEDKRDISIEQVRQLQDKLNQSSLWGGRQVAVIQSAERLSLPAANALLKTLEETRRQVVVIMLADSTESLPATIVSRCQLVRLNPLPTAVIEQALLQQGVAAAVAKTLAWGSHGRPGLALAWLADREQLSAAQARGDQLAALIAPPTAAWPVIDQLTKDNLNLADWRTILLQWQLVIHEAVLIKLGLLSLTTAASAATVNQVAGWSWTRLAKVWTNLVNLGHNLDKNINIRLSFESIVLQSL